MKRKYFYNQIVVSINGNQVRYTGDMKILISCSPEICGKFIIPDSVECILSDAFLNCKKITSLYIGKSVQRVSAYCFKALTSLRSISASPENSHFVVQNGLLYTKSDIHNLVVCPQQLSGKIEICCHTGTLENNAFFGCKNLTHIELPLKLSTIGAECFSGCTSICVLKIPECVQVIGKNAFKNCENLKTLIFKNPSGWFSQKQIDDYVLKYVAVPETELEKFLPNGLFRHVPGNKRTRMYIAQEFIPSETVFRYQQPLKHCLSTNDIDVLIRYFSFVKNPAFDYEAAKQFPYISIPCPFRKGDEVSLCGKKESLGTVVEIKNFREWKDRDEKNRINKNATFAENFILVRFLCRDGTVFLRKINPLCLEKVQKR